MENGAATQQCPHYMPRGAWHCHTSSVPGAAQWLLISIPSLGTPDGQYPPLKWSALSLTCCVTSPFCAQISSFHSSLTAAITNVHKLGDLKCWTAGQELEVQCPQGPVPAGSSRGKHLPASRCLWCQCWHHRQRQSSASSPWLLGKHLPSHLGLPWRTQTDLEIFDYTSKDPSKQALEVTGCEPLSPLLSSME